MLFHIIIPLLVFPFTKGSDGPFDKNWCYQDPPCLQTNKQTPWHKGFCIGKNQSPINLTTDDPEKVATLDFSSTLKNYNFNKFRITNNGRTIQLDEFVTQTGKPPSFIWKVKKGKEKTYNLLQVHFHWGGDADEGSEHVIENKRLPFEMHLVHLRSDLSSPKQAVDSEQPDALAVIGILFEISYNDDQQGTFDSVARAVKNVRNSRGAHFTVEEGKLMLGSVIANVSQPVTVGDLPVHYMGSLTTPPCNEVVSWAVATMYPKIKEQNLIAFRNSVKEESGKQLTKNFRHLQEQGTRKTNRVEFDTRPPPNTGAGGSNPFVIG